MQLSKSLQNKTENKFQPVYSLVYKEHTLGYILEKITKPIDIQILCILHTSVLRGSNISIHSNYILTQSDTKFCRYATKKDFEDFGVLWNPDYLVVEQ